MTRPENPATRVNGVPPVAIVTGAADGVGRATALTLAGNGWSVIAGDLSDKVHSLDELDNVDAFTIDAATAEGNATLIDEAVARHGHLDAAVLNVGTFATVSILEDDALSVLRRLITVNLESVVLGIQAAVPAFTTRDRAGSIVVTSSISATGGDAAGFWAYGASKSAVNSVVQSAAREFGCANIRINAVCPALVENTGLTRGRKDGNPDHYHGIRQTSALQRWCSADEQAAVIEFLCGPGSSYVTGVILPVDGGVTSGTGMFLPARDRDHSAPVQRTAAPVTTKG